MYIVYVHCTLPMHAYAPTSYMYRILYIQYTVHVHDCILYIQCTMYMYLYTPVS